MVQLLIGSMAFVAAFVQGLAGLGIALIAMPLLAGMLGVKVAAPLVALIALTAYTILLVRYRQALNLQAISRLLVGSVFGIPLGVFALRHVDERVILTLLGIVLTSYSLYSLLNPNLPRMAHPRWAYLLGFVGGVLAGAYNTPGPAVAIYGNCRQWQTEEFKGNLQGFFLLNSAIVMGSHILSDNVTPFVCVAI